MPLVCLGSARTTEVSRLRFLSFCLVNANTLRCWNCLLRMFVINVECLVNALLYIALVTSLLFVHTARRSYRLVCVVICLEKGSYCSVT